jgi:hypothetical protein
MTGAPPYGKVCSNHESMWDTQPNQGLQPEERSGSEENHPWEAVHVVAP